MRRCIFFHWSAWPRAAATLLHRSPQFSTGLEPTSSRSPICTSARTTTSTAFASSGTATATSTQQDDAARALYQSRLCEAIKALNRTHERSAANPGTLDFGAVRYVIPSHFGFCLGVKNAIERAYETLAENPAGGSSC
jgi:hypothetical protein